MPTNTCPYGADDCPKIENLKEIIKANSEELSKLNKEVVSLISIMKTVAFIIGLFVTFASAVVGILFVR